MLIAIARLVLSIGAAATFLACSIEKADAQDISWRRVGTPRDARKIAVCSDGRLLALNADFSLWQNLSRGADRAWTRIGTLPRDTRSMTCAANVVYFLRAPAGTDREIWRLGRAGAPERMGRARSAREISGTHDTMSGAAVIWALNDDNSLWQSTLEGAEGSFIRREGPGPHRKIAATSGQIFAFDADRTLSRSRSVRPDSIVWERLDAPSDAIEVGAFVSEARDTYQEVTLFALNRDFSLWEGTITKWVIKLGQVTAVRTDEAESEPYFVMFNFRSRMGTAGSSTVTLNRFEEPLARRKIRAGQARTIPASMGEAVFSNVRRTSSAAILAAGGGALPEVLGSIVIAMESDGTPWANIRTVVRNLRQALREELAAQIESLTVADALAIATNPALLQARIAAAEGGIMSRVRDKFSAAEILSLIGGAILAGGDIDNVVGIHAFFFVAVDSSVAITETSDGLRTSGRLRARPSVPLTFSGSGNEFAVTAHVF